MLLKPVTLSHSKANLALNCLKFEQCLSLPFFLVVQFTTIDLTDLMHVFKKQTIGLLIVYLLYYTIGVLGCRI